MANKHAQILGRRGGKSTSERKQAASRANGTKGGRPAKNEQKPIDTGIPKQS